MLPYRWEELTAPEFNEAVEKSKGLCILPIGCSERHGRHIAVGCDAIQAKAIADAAAEKEYAVVFPTGFWLGEVVGNHSLDLEEAKKAEKRGYISLNPTTIINLLDELCAEIARNGFRKILIVNYHGGNTQMLNFFVRGQMYEKKDYAVMWTDPNMPETSNADIFASILANLDKYPDISEEDVKVMQNIVKNGVYGGHGHINETAVCYAVSPAFVRPEFFGDDNGHSQHRTDYLSKMGVTHGGAWGVNYPNAYHADPSTGCTEAIGKAALDVYATELAQKYKMLKEDEFCVKISQRDV